MEKRSYLHLDYEPDPKRDFIVLAWMRGRAPLEKLANEVAAESSTGTWTPIKTMNERVFKEYSAKVFRIEHTSDNAGFAWIAYPIEHFDRKNVLQFMASVLGNIFGMGILEGLYIGDISIPEEYQKQFKGPELGLEGIRKYLGVKDRPLVGTIVKPKVGLSPSEWAEVAYKAWSNGLDLVKDDENLVDQDFCPWKERFDRAFELLDRAESETGEKKVYSVNITDSNVERMIERLEYLHERGHKTAMIDVFVMGMAVVKEIIDEARKLGIWIHGHRAGYAAHHRAEFGVNFEVYAKFYRLFGVDQLHVGTGVGKMGDAPLEVRRLRDVVVEKELEEAFYLLSLPMKYREDIKPTFPIASGGLHPGHVDALSAIFGKDVIIQAGGGVPGHPGGTEAGARALRAAAEAVKEGVSVKEMAERVPELKEAIGYWGYKNPKEIEEIFRIAREHREVLDILVKRRGYEGFKAIMEDVRL